MTQDTPRPEAIEVIQELKKSGYILTMVLYVCHSIIFLEG